MGVGGVGPDDRKLSEHFHLDGKWKHLDGEEWVGVDLCLPEGTGKGRVGGLESGTSMILWEPPSD